MFVYCIISFKVSTLFWGWVLRFWSVPDSLPARRQNPPEVSLEASKELLLVRDEASAQHPVLDMVLYHFDTNRLMDQLPYLEEGEAGGGALEGLQVSALVPSRRIISSIELDTMRSLNISFIYLWLSSALTKLNID